MTDGQTDRPEQSCCRPGINNSSQVVNQPGPTAVCHTQKNVRPFNQGYDAEDGGGSGRLSVGLQRKE